MIIQKEISKYRGVPREKISNQKEGKERIRVEGGKALMKGIIPPAGSASHGSLLVIQLQTLPVPGWTRGFATTPPKTPPPRPPPPPPLPYLRFPLRSFILSQIPYGVRILGTPRFIPPFPSTFVNPYLFIEILPHATGIAWWRSSVDTNKALPAWLRGTAQGMFFLPFPKIPPQVRENPGAFRAAPG